MAAASKQEVEGDVHKPVTKQAPSILALGKLFPANPTLDHAVRFLSQVRGTDKTLMVGHPKCILAGKFVVQVAAANSIPLHSSYMNVPHAHPTDWTSGLQGDRTTTETVGVSRIIILHPGALWPSKLSTWHTERTAHGKIQSALNDHGHYHTTSRPN